MSGATQLCISPLRSLGVSGSKAFNRRDCGGIAESAKTVFRRKSSATNTNAADFSAALFISNLQSDLPRSFLQHSLLQFFLTLDAVACPGDGFQALGVDFLAAVDAFAEAAFADARESLIHHL
jgi:hypothetical protein